ncbi:tubulin--tyrosine ligase-like protein 12 [Patiria miniata]|uniref:Tubulin--tyrosine ligase-like protein 12 SET-like domain-containing protein n=1 Tax=Patiria miniata TaxID=46514 RepID=A0A914ATK8_PATMI|nr:tubulin--tyrosine ligase-like protein 12 [Patiria miniata]
MSRDRSSCSARMENGRGKTDFSDFVAIHKSQLEISGVPETFWHSIYNKLENQLFDAGQRFMLTYLEEEDAKNEGDKTGGGDSGEAETATEAVPPKLRVVVSDEEGIDASNEDSIYLIDHAWTYRFIEARMQLQQVPGLLSRMMNLMGITQTEGQDRDECINKVLAESWKYSRTYSMNAQGLKAEDRQPMWYILDEFGSRIRHDDTPSCRLVPFFYIPEQIAYSLLFPLQDLEYGDDVTVDYAFPLQDPLLRQVRLLPWQPNDLTHISPEQPEPDLDYMTRVCNNTNPEVGESPVLRDVTGKLKVYSDHKQTLANLHHPQFEFVDKEEDADVLFLESSFRDFRKLSNETHQYVNQFPGEKLIVTKDMLALTSRESGKHQSGASCCPKWLPVTYDLWNNLPQFVSYFQQQQKKGALNIWICKPFNLARGLDTTVTNNLNQIIRQTETDIPKVACEYLTDPVLFVRDGIGPVKFDIRYVVMFTSVKPLKVYAYKIFWLRFANKPFSLDNLDDYNKHFTVMNYATEEPGENFFQMLWHEFPGHFNKQNPDFDWDEVEASIHDMIREFFQAAVSKPPPRGITHCPWSRAVYALDIMLKWDTDDTGKKVMQPVLLECNFMPDCERACWHRKEFFDDIFSTLFLGDIKDRPVKELC